MPVTVQTGSGLLLAGNTTSTPESCAGRNDGSATINISTPGMYGYSWNTVPVQTSATATGLGSGVYTVTISNGTTCGQTMSVTVQTGTGPTITTNSLSTPETCAGRSDGTATIQVNQPGTYSYSWNTVPPQNGATASHVNSL